MAKLDKIPKKQLVALESLVLLSEENFQKLSSAAKETPPALSPSVFSKKIAVTVPTIPAETVEGIIEILCGLSYLLDYRRVSIPEIMAGIVDSAKEEQPEGFTQLHSNLQTLEIRIKHLITLEQTLGITGKALGVMLEHDHIFGYARILSDVRPVFTSSVDSAAGSFIIHNLCIHYRQDGQHKEFFAAMDNADLKTLKEAIDRAEKKTSILKDTLKSVGIPYLDAE